jgi:hypothetical protein
VPQDSPSRRRIFVCHPETVVSGFSRTVRDEAACATRILSTLARCAYRRETTNEDIQTLLGFYKTGRAEGDFETGIRSALERLLVSPDFLFRIEADPDHVAPGTAYRLTGVELASRLSFFLWSSIPDDELLDLAIGGKLRDARVVDRQVRRMLADPRARAALEANFFSQWLQIRNVWLITPDANRKYLTVDANNLLGSCDVGYSCAQQHAVLAYADAAADGGKRPARRLRAPVRLDRQHGSARARVPSPPGPEHSRLCHGPREAAAAEAWSD